MSVVAEETASDTVKLPRMAADAGEAFLQCESPSPRPQAAAHQASSENGKAPKNERGAPQQLLQEEMHVLVSRGLSASALRSACQLASYHGVHPVHYMMRNAILTEEAYYSAVAEVCGVPFLPAGSFRPLLVNGHVLQCGPGEAGPMMIGLGREGPVYVVAPEPEHVAELRAFFLRHPDWSAAVRIATPSALRHALTVLNAPAGELEARFPHMSARTRVTPRQQIGAGAMAASFFAGMVLPFDVQMLLLSLVVGLTCILTAIARLSSARQAQERARLAAEEAFFPSQRAAAQPHARPFQEEWPLYTVLVPLYKEAAVVPSLVDGLARLDYPADRLDIRFLVEQDDRETRVAFRGLLREGMEVVVVPPGHPRTKPRALAYGLDSSMGEFVTIYDAEDRPEPGQLKKAVRKFRESPESLACLQASLVIDNAEESFFTRQFAMEYASLFDQVIPWFSGEEWPFPLGGTSNHFRRAALVTAGGWDPYNVTEDADLGLRLARFGFTSAALDSATYEEAPVTWKVWYAQRARWYKGWLQTVLVHLRDPSMLWHDMSPRRAVPIAFLIGGSLLTLGLHPIFCMILMGYLIGLWNMPVPDGLMSDITVCLSALAAISGYGAAVIAGRSAARARGFDPRFSDLALIPAYWLCASFAFYRAVWDFFIRPHHWHKTTHGTARKRKTPDFGKKGEDGRG